MIDVHTHALEPEHWGAEFDQNWRPAYGRDWPPIDPTAFDEAMSSAGVELAIVFGISASAAGVHVPTHEVAAFCEATSTTTVGFMAIDPSDDDWSEQLVAGVELGMRGIKLYPVMAQFDPRADEFDEFYQSAHDQGLTLLWHMGATPCAEGDLSVSLPIVIDSVARRFPELPQIIAHMAHPWQRDCVQVLRKHRNVYADISGMWTRPMDGYLALVNAQEWNVTSKLLFGSDFPLWTPAEAVDGLYRLTELGGQGMPRVEIETIQTILANDPREALGL